MEKAIEPPTGCMEIPGYILTVKNGKAWITSGGQVTSNFAERGVWGSQEDADAARDFFFGDDE